MKSGLGCSTQERRRSFVLTALRTRKDVGFSIVGSLPPTQKCLLRRPGAGHNSRKKLKKTTFHRDDEGLTSGNSAS
jgi:hypothetical protein